MIITPEISGLIMVFGALLATIGILILVNLTVDRKIHPIVFILGVTGIAFLLIYSVSLLPQAPPQYTGEIIKLYVNGTALLDNGTLVKIPWIGCP